MTIKELNTYCQTNNKHILIRRGKLIGIISNNTDW